MSQIYILCSSINGKGEWTNLNTKQGLSAWCTTWKVSFLTTNYGYNEFADLWVIVTICRATGKICFLNTSYGHLLSLSYKRFFPDDWSCRGKLHAALPKSYRHSSNLHCEYVTTCMRSWYNFPVLEWGEGGLQVSNQICQKIFHTNRIGVALHYVKAIITYWLFSQWLLLACSWQHFRGLPYTKCF